MFKESVIYTTKRTLHHLSHFDSSKRRDSNTLPLSYKHKLEKLFTLHDKYILQIVVQLWMKTAKNMPLESKACMCVWRKYTVRMALISEVPKVKVRIWREHVAIYSSSTHIHTEQNDSHTLSQACLFSFWLVRMRTHEYASVRFKASLLKQNKRDTGIKKLIPKQETKCGVLLHYSGLKTEMTSKTQRSRGKAEPESSETPRTPCPTLKRSERHMAGRSGWFWPCFSGSKPLHHVAW